MKRIYTIILLFVLVFRPIHAQSGPTDGLKGISLTGHGTKNGQAFAIGSSATKSTVNSTTTKSSKVAANDTITQIGFFKDRHCVAVSGSLVQPVTSSCGIGCGTGSGSMANCWKGGLGVYLYNPTAIGTLTKDSARSATRFLLFDAEGKELTRAFLESIPSAANGKITIKVKGYWTAQGIASNKNEKVVPELIADSVDHYLKSFHLYSIEGIYIKDGITKSYSYFDTASYKLTPTDLAPKNIIALHYSAGTKIKFTAPGNASSTTSTLSGYKVQVYDAAGNIVDKYTTTVTDPKATSVYVPGFVAGSNYTFTVSALYTGSGVEAESQASSGIITQAGFFKDRDCVNSVTLPLIRSCGIGCGTGAGSMAGCWKSGLGLFIYDPSQTGIITRDSALTTSHYLLFDPQSKELTRAFIESLPSAASGKISIKVSGYWSADSIPSNKIETVVPELTADSIDHKLPAFHLLSIEGVTISGLTNSYTGFTTNPYKLTPADLAPKNLSAVLYSGGTKVNFTAPANVSSAKTTLTSYKVRVYNPAGSLVDKFTTTVNDASITSINIPGFTASGANTITVAALYPGSGVEAVSDASNGTETQIGWFKDRDCLFDSISLPLKRSCGIECAFGSGTMAWCWNSGLGVFIYNPDQRGKISPDSARTEKHYLLFDAQSKELFKAFLLKLPAGADGKISVKVTGYRVEKGISANKTEWNVPELNSDSVNHYLNAFHLLSVEGIYIDTLANSYDGFATSTYKVIPEDLSPTNVSAVNFTGGATVKFTPPANARKKNSNLSGYKVRVYNGAEELQSTYTTISNDTTATSINVPGLIANSGYFFTVAALYPSSAVEAESVQSNIVESSTDIKNNTKNGISVYPTLSRGEITVVSPAEAKIKVFDYTGRIVELYQSSGSRTISLNVPSGLYFVSVESAGEISVQRVIIRK